MKWTRFYIKRRRRQQEELLTKEIRNLIHQFQQTPTDQTLKQILHLTKKLTNL